MALVVLNSPLDPDDALFPVLWQNSVLRVAADGGSVRIASLNSARAKRSTSVDPIAEYIPDAVVGDMDSAPPALLRRLSALGADIVTIDDQDSTDFHKAVSYVIETRRLGTLPPLCAAVSTADATASATPAALTTASAADCSSNTPVSLIVCYGAFGGRFDQQLSCLSALYAHAAAPAPARSAPGPATATDCSAASASEDAAAGTGASALLPKPRLVLMGDGNVAELLAPGAHCILMPHMPQQPTQQQHKRACEQPPFQQAPQAENDSECESECEWNQDEQVHDEGIYCGFMPLYSQQPAPQGCQRSHSQSQSHCPQAHACGSESQLQSQSHCSQAPLVVTSGFKWDVGTESAVAALRSTLTVTNASTVTDSVGCDATAAFVATLQQHWPTTDNANNNANINTAASDGAIPACATNVPIGRPPRSGADCVINAFARSFGAEMRLGGLISTSNRLPPPHATVSSVDGDGRAPLATADSEQVTVSTAGVVTTHPLLWTAAVGSKKR